MDLVAALLQPPDERQLQAQHLLHGKRSDTLHFANFADAIREGRKLNAEIGDGQKSTMLCHLGNIAWRSARTVNYDAQAGKIVGDRAATALWRRDYRQGWEPKV